MADARDSKSREGNFMRVRPPPSAPEKKLHPVLVFEQVQKASLLDLFFLFFCPRCKPRYAGGLGQSFKWFFIDRDKSLPAFGTKK